MINYKIIEKIPNKGLSLYHNICIEYCIFISFIEINPVLSIVYNNI